MTLHINPADYPGLLTAVIGALFGYKIKGEFTNAAFPTECEVVRIAMDEIGQYEMVVCDLDDNGAALRHHLTHIGFDEIVSITIV
jgi:hypothetical protein